MTSDEVVRAIATDDVPRLRGEVEEMLADLPEWARGSPFISVKQTSG